MTWYVPDNFPGGIQEAIDSAISGDTIIVKDGTYYEAISFCGKNLLLKSENGPHKTTIDAMGTGSVVLFANSENNAAIIDGFTLSHGLGTELGGKTYGGGIFCHHASPTIINSKIIDCYAFEGGGISCYECSPHISNNLVAKNQATFGSGISCRQSNSTIYSCDIELNTGNGIIFMGYSKGYIINCRVSGNTDRGISCHTDHCLIWVINTLVYSNTGNTKGGGLYFNEGGGYIVNSTICGNAAVSGGETYGGGIALERKSIVSSYNTIYWNNQAGHGKQISVEVDWDPATFNISYSDVQGGKNKVYNTGVLNWGEGMLDEYPQFVNSAIGDYHLTYISPCRDKGTNTAPGMASTDAEGDPRISCGNVDMGIDEFYPHLYYTGDASPGGYVEGKLVGFPNAIPVVLFFGMNLLKDPINTKYGQWFLELPIVAIGELAPVPPNGIIILSASVPYQPEPAYLMQALIGNILSNACILHVE